MNLEENTTVLFTGDSITDCGRDRATGGLDLGGGYAAWTAALLQARYPSHGYHFLNTGIGGNRVTDLEARWNEDVVKHHPDYVSVMIGINDVWRQFDRPWMEQVDPRQFAEKLEGLVQRTLPEAKGMILMTPFFIEPNREDPMRRMMDEYGSIVEKIARSHGTLFVDTQGAFDSWLKHNPSQRLCADRVHPNLTGHAILSQTLLQALGVSWSG